jgi:undecaprenyl-diphosphatase
MDWILALKAIILGLVEGFTEFLPISSTGHLILANSLLNFNIDHVKSFMVVVQMGAIFAVLIEFRMRIVNTISGIGKDAIAQRFAINVMVACLPVIVLAKIFGDFIESKMFTPLVVALAFIIGGVVILFVESISAKTNWQNARIQTLDDLNWRDALKVGLAQCLAVLFPGTSRSGATIIGGMLLGIPRKVATEFSFFLALVVLSGAGVYSLIKDRHFLLVSDAGYWGLGLLAAFASAYFCIRWLIKFVSTHSFTGFAWYRIAFGGFILLSYWQGWIDWSQKVG